MKRLCKNNPNNFQKAPLLTAIILIVSLLSALTVHAQTVADAVKQLGDSLGMGYDSTTEEVTDYNLTVHYCSGAYQNGEVGLYALGPLKSAEIQAVSDELFDYSGSTGSATTPMKGGEVRRYSTDYGVVVSVVLRDFMIVIEIMDSGGSKEQDFQAATDYAQLMLDALEKNGLLSGKAPDLEAVITNTAPSSVTGEGVPGTASAGEDVNSANDGISQNDSANSYGSDSPAAIGPVGDIPGPANNTQSVVGVVVPGLLATALGALSGLAGGGASPLGGTTPEAPQTGMKRSRFSEDTATGRETDVNPFPSDGGRELTGDENQFNQQKQIFTDSADEMILEKFKNVLPEEDTAVADTEEMAIDTSEILTDGTILADDFGGALPETDILTEDGRQVTVDTNKIDQDYEILTDEYEDFFPEENTVQTDSDQAVIDDSAFETGKKTDLGHLEETEINGETKTTDEDVVVEDDTVIIGDENPVVSDAIPDGEETVSGEGIEEIINPDEKKTTLPEEKPADPDKPTASAKDEEEAAAAANAKPKDPTTPANDEKSPFDKNGFDKNGYDQEGFDKNGYNQEGYDRYGYNRTGFNKNGYDRDGYDLQGFDYKGYNREGFDPFGYNRQGYGKDGYHWSGYNADGYDRNGKHWNDQSLGPLAKNPFDEDGIVIPVNADGTPIATIKPTAPPLGQPYPKTAEKFGPKTWDTPATSPETPATPSTPTAPTNPTTPSTPTTPTTGTTPTSSTSTTGEAVPIEVSTPPEPEVAVPPPPTDAAAPTDSIKDTGIIGPEDPLNTLNQHPLGGDSATTESSGPTPSSQPISVPTDSDLVSNGIDGDKTAVPEVPNDTPTTPTLPKDGETQILTGQTDGRSYEIKYDAKTGQWINTESGNYFDPDKFDQWQKDLAVDKAIAAETMAKFANRSDANSLAIDQHLADFKNLTQIQKTADKFDFGTAGGPGDVDKAIEDLKNEMLSGKNLDHEKLEQIKNVIEGRIKGRTTADPGKGWEEVPWYEDVNSALKANAESIRNIVTGEDEDGNTSYLGMAGRMVIGAATGGASEYVMTVAEALNNVKKGIDAGKSGWDATTDAITKVVTDEAVSFGMDKAGELGTGFIKKTFPKATQKLGDLVDAAGSKLDDLNQRASKKLGLIADEGADQAVNKINQNMAKKAAGTADEIGDRATKGVSQSADDLAGKKGLKPGEKPSKEAYDAATQKIKDQKDKVSQKADELIENYRTNSQQNLKTIERDELFKEGRKAGKQKVDDMAVAQQRLKANPDSAEAKKAYDEAMTAVQQDKHAMHNLNDLDGPDAKEIREAFNTKMSHKAEVADLNAKERIAKEFGVRPDQVKTVGATNTMDTSGGADPTGFAQKTKGSPTDGTAPGKYTEDNITAQTKGGDKTSYDIDKTYRVQVGETIDPKTGKVTPIYKDIPAEDTKRLFGEEYYKQFHDGKLPTKIENGIEVVDQKAVEKFSKEMDVSAVDHRSAEGYGAGDHDLKNMLKKDGTVKNLDDIEAATKTMEYKANEWENHAEELREQAKKATGDERAELLAKAEGLSEESMRQTTKQFNNQICEQVKAINLAKGQEVVKIPDKLFTAINVMEKVGKPKGGLSVVEAEEILKGMGLTPKQVSQQMSSLMESMQKFNK